MTKNRVGDEGIFGAVAPVGRGLFDIAIKLFIFGLLLPVLLGVAWYASSKGVERVPPNIICDPPISTISDKPVSCELEVADKGVGLGQLSVKLKRAEGEHVILSERLNRGEFFRTDLVLERTKIPLRDGPADLVFSVSDDSIWQNTSVINMAVVLDSGPPVTEVVYASQKIVSGGTGFVLFRVVDEGRFSSVVMSGKRRFSTQSAKLFDEGFNDPELYAAFFSAKLGELPLLVVTDESKQEFKVPIPTLVESARSGSAQSEVATLSAGLSETIQKLIRNESVNETIIAGFPVVELIPRIMRGEHPSLKASLNYLMNESRNATLLTAAKGPADEGSKSPRQFERLPVVTSRRLISGYDDEIIVDSGDDGPLWQGRMVGNLYDVVGPNDTFKAPFSGTVKTAGELGVFGTSVVVSHGVGVTSIISHLSEVSVQSGQLVKQGQDVGMIGSTGIASRPQVGVTWLVGEVTVNPTDWLDEQSFREVIQRPIDEALKHFRSSTSSSGK